MEKGLMLSNGIDSKQDSKSPKKKRSKMKVQKMDDLRRYSESSLFTYVENLHSLLKKKEKKLKKYKEKVKKLAQRNAELQNGANLTIKAEQAAKNLTTSDEFIGDFKAKDLDSAKDINEPLSFADEIRQAAEAAQNQTGFIYEPTSGLYYDQKTGYYYNAECGLYYDGNTGCYYEYNQEKNEFRFHSRPEGIKTTECEEDRDNDVFDNYVNSKLLDKFSDLKIGQMRENALGKKYGRNKMDDDSDREEWGVPIKKQKKKEKKGSKSKRNDRRRKHQSKKRRHFEERGGSSEGDAQKSAEMEDGEVMSSATSTLSDDEGSVTKCHYRDIAKKYPPSLRIIVQETNLDKLKVGTLRLITFKGGTLGREGSHDVVIPDVNVSKFHLKFTYNTKENVYKCTDLGSRNGTILNGSRMSNAMQESEPIDLVHGSVIQISQTKLLCHIHAGNSTCGQCEPGLLMDIQSAPVSVAINAAPVTLTHKEQLKKIQKKYGLENEKYVEARQINESYNDRAATRRTKVGSSNSGEKTQTASVNDEIPSENKGFKMLAKLGWNKGETLGKSNTVGLLEPINVNANEGKKGLGCDEQINVAQLTKAHKQKIFMMKKTQERYNKSVQPDIFHESSSDNDGDENRIQ